jgi:phosphatidylserine decarboxylase
MTGQLEEEKMQVYVRLGIRLLYKVILYVNILELQLTNTRVQKVGWRELVVCVLLIHEPAVLGADSFLARRLLKSLSIKQGVKYDSPDSARDILPFIEFHKLNIDEIEDPIHSFSKFYLFS